MRILYVGKHNSGDNDDEGAITHAMVKLGHEMICISEARLPSINHLDYDFALFNKPENLDQIRKLKRPKVFWFFDLIQHDDFHLGRRSRDRAKWVTDLTEICDLGFLTDGDWVKANPEKLVHLMQGADERVVGFGKPDSTLTNDLLFTGTSYHGEGRVNCINELKSRYNVKFTHIGDRGRNRVHGRDMANLIASHKIVIAPISPVTDVYWSNRAYQALGFGGFLLHPYCEGLLQHYHANREIVYYHSMPDLVQSIDYYLTNPAKRREIAAGGLRRTIETNLYRHRCADLITAVKERLGL